MIIKKRKYVNYKNYGYVWLRAHRPLNYFLGIKVFIHDQNTITVGDTLYTNVEIVNTSKTMRTVHNKDTGECLFFLGRFPHDEEYPCARVLSKTEFFYPKESERACEEYAAGIEEATEIDPKGIIKDAVLELLSNKEEVSEYVVEIKQLLDKKESKESAIASNMKFMLKLLFLVGEICLAIAAFALGYMFYLTERMEYLLLYIPLLIIIILVIILHREIKNLTKSDSYNMLILVLTIIALILSVYGIVR